MKEKILQLLRGLRSITEKAKVKWSEGASEDEYYINFEDKGLVIAKMTTTKTEYELRFLKPDGGVQFTCLLDNSDGEAYQEAESLFNIITSSSPEASMTMDALLRLINAKEEEQSSLETLL